MSKLDLIYLRSPGERGRLLSNRLNLWEILQSILKALSSAAQFYWKKARLSDSAIPNQLL